MLIFASVMRIKLLYALRIAVIVLSMTACNNDIFIKKLLLSTDYAEPDMLEALYAEAQAGNCDYVWCDWFLTFGTNSRVMIQPGATTPREALSIALSGGMKYNVWNKLVARKLYDVTGIRFPEGRSMGEDMTMLKLLAKATCIWVISTGRRARTAAVLMPASTAARA